MPTSASLGLSHQSTRPLPNRRTCGLLRLAGWRPCHPSIPLNVPTSHETSETASAVTWHQSVSRRVVRRNRSSTRASSCRPLVISLRCRPPATGLVVLPSAGSTAPRLASTCCESSIAARTDRAIQGYRQIPYADDRDDGGPAAQRHRYRLPPSPRSGTDGGAIFLRRVFIQPYLGKVVKSKLHYVEESVCSLVFARVAKKRSFGLGPVETQKTEAAQKTSELHVALGPRLDLF